MKILRPIFITAFLTVLSAAVYPADKPIAVAGFINLGAAKDNNINMVITKSLISFLSKIPDKSVVQYAEIEKSALKSGIWTNKNINIDEALFLGQEFSCDKVVIGDYIIDDKNNQITINVYAYDVVTAEIKLKRTYTGSTGLDLFDTIDSMIRNVTGVIVGRNVTFGKAIVKINNSVENYKIVLNGAVAGIASSETPLTTDILAGESSLVQIRLSNSDELVYQVSIKVEAGATNTIEYIPMGKAIAKLGKHDAGVYVDGKLFTNALKGDSIDIPNLTAGENHIISIKKASGNPESKTVKLREAETLVLIFDEFKFPFRITGYVSLGMAILAAGGGIYFNGDYLQNMDDAAKKYKDYKDGTTDLGTKWDEYNSRVTAAENSATMRNVFFITSGVLLAYGISTGFIINEDGFIFGAKPDKVYISIRF